MIDIYSKGIYPACDLSNFAHHPFLLDGVQIASMEGFLQSLKFSSENNQKRVCLLSGKNAKLAGKKKIRWYISRTVSWKGERLHLFSDEFQILIDRAYNAMYEQNPEFQQALRDSGEEELHHTIGKNRLDKTILTEYHFIRRLEKLREKAKQEER